jgi:hypothetical protein
MVLTSAGKAMAIMMSPMAKVTIISTKLYPATLCGHLRRNDFMPPRTRSDPNFIPIWNTIVERGWYYPPAWS